MPAITDCPNQITNFDTSNGYVNQCTSQQCIAIDGRADCSCLDPNAIRDCSCTCQIPGQGNFPDYNGNPNLSFRYTTDCSCSPGGTCQTICSDEINYYCISPEIECPAIMGCTDTNADNFNPEATQDDGSCEYPSTFIEKPTFSNRWTFVFNNNSVENIDDQIISYDGNLHEGPYDVSNIYYLNVEFLTDLSCVDIHRLDGDGEWQDPNISCSWGTSGTLGNIYGQKAICEDGTEVITCYDETLQYGCGTTENPWLFYNGNNACDSVLHEAVEGDMIFAFINDELRGVANIQMTNQTELYTYLEVKWKQALELNEIITFYVQHNDQIYSLNNIKDPNDNIIENAITTLSIYE